MFLHIAEGLLLAIFVGWLAGEKVTLSFVFFGASAALALDFDFLYYWVKSGFKLNRSVLKHRELFHKPLLVALIGGAVFYYLCGFSFGLLWFLNIIMHCVNDEFSDDLGGIQWLWPFVKKEWRAKIIDLRVRLKQFEKEYTFNERTVREGLIFLAAFSTVLLWVFV